MSSDPKPEASLLAACHRLAPWMSAALGDDEACAELKAAATAFLEALAQQPTAEAPPSPYNRKRIAWELERTAMGDGYYGGALRAAKYLPEATPSVRSLLDRWATGKERGLADRTDLCAFALQIYEADRRSPSDPVAELASRQQPLGREHGEVLAAHLDEFLDTAPQQAIAPVGVRGREAAEHDQFAAIVNALHGAGESMERSVVLARGVAAALAQQPAAVDGAMVGLLAEAEKHIETLHSIVGGEARHIVWKLIVRIRAALAGQQQGGTSE